jgi:hypothetical protein
MRRVSRISSGTISATLGYCTFTATTRPSCLVARCTWASDAAEAEPASKDAKASSTGPRSASTMRRTAAAGAGGTRSCSRDSCST